MEKIFRIASPILWVGVIFSFSLSSNPAGDLPDWVAAFAGPIAHLLEFFILGLLMYSTRQRVHFKRLILYGLLIAVADEFLQLFVPGRVTDVVDVLVDMLGLFSGLMLAQRSARLMPLLWITALVLFAVSATRVLLV